MRTKRKAEEYAREVAQVLHEHLPGYDPEAEAVVLKFVADHWLAAEYKPWWEVIVDSPFSARWRLRSSRELGRVRLSYHSPSDHVLERTVNARLARLP